MEFYNIFLRLRIIVRKSLYYSVKSMPGMDFSDTYQIQFFCGVVDRRLHLHAVKVNAIRNADSSLTENDIIV